MFTDTINKHVQRPVRPDLLRHRRRGPGHPAVQPRQQLHDKHSADAGGFKVGDKVRILTQAGPGVYTITGIATRGGADSPLGATITAFDPGTAARVLGQPGKVNELDVQAKPGVSQDTLVTRIRDAIHTPGVEVVSGLSVTAEGQQTVHQQMSYGLLAVAILAGLGGLVAAITPSRRAARLNILRAVTTE